ncbi:hypothetical protein XA3_18840 [Xylocopilactobacillus apicola]|uniref:Sortase n=2 Tax=Xylocopilactobacillus apicola TaxID=2932184 RepID=A0AAU9D7D1_9LACO|nr:hypothetical protein XA3_18840 [Xylocopilactobacillus apicola]
MKHYVNQTDVISHKQIENNKKKKANFDPKVVHSLKSSDMIKGWNYKVSPIGYIVIPTVDIRNPVFKGYGESGNNLLHGVGTMKPNQIMGAGNYALAGHYMNNQTVFHNLSKAKVGEDVYLTDLKFFYKYRISSIQRNVAANRTDLIEDHLNMTQITMITCESLVADSLRTVVQGNLLATYKVTHRELYKLGLVE